MSLGAPFRRAAWTRSSFFAGNWMPPRNRRTSSAVLPSNKRSAMSAPCFVKISSDHDQLSELVATRVPAGTRVALPLKKRPSLAHFAGGTSWADPQTLFSHEFAREVDTMFDNIKPVASLSGRILLSLIFLLAGIMKIMDWNGTTAYMASKGMPAIPFFLTMAILFELGAGTCLLFGFQARSAALALVFFLIPTTLV